jgi:PTH1 family peptidyl-tRNA hydrolase
MDIAGLLLGLGNPGPEFAGTRHNFGFLLVDCLLARCSDVSPLSGGKGRYEAWLCRFSGSGARWIVAKPLTYMNKSGDPAAHLLGYYRIPLQSLWVAHDELDLPLGRMRYKFGGGAAGHNGIRSIAERTGSPDFHRLRLGIGKPEGYDTVAYVLGRFNPGEKKIAGDVAAAAAGLALTLPGPAPERFQQQVNSFSALEK